MKTFVVALAIMSLSVPAMGALTYFNSTTNGSWDVRVDTEGYSDSGASGTPRMGGGGGTRSNWGFTSFYGATASGQTLSQYLTANPAATATLYVCASSTIANGAYVLETLRSGNSGALKVDSGSSAGQAWNAPNAGITGAAESPAFAMGAPAYAANGDFNGTTSGTPWITPSGRTGSWGSSSPATGGQPITYSNPGTGYQVGGGLENRTKGIWAVADVLGVWGGNNGSATVANISAAGQYLNGGMTTPSLFGSANIVGSDPKGNAAPSGYAWLAIPIDASMLNDIANNSQDKALVFNNAVTGVGITVSSGWDLFKNDGTHASYLAVNPTPEPATLCLLALGGLALLRRRHA